MNGHCEHGWRYLSCRICRTEGDEDRKAIAAQKVDMVSRRLNQLGASAEMVTEHLADALVSDRAAIAALAAKTNKPPTEGADDE